MKKFIFVILFSLIAKSGHAAVWNSNQEFTDRWYQSYSNWVATSVGPNFFKELGSPFSSLKIDCADAHYALLAYYARENGLTLRINNGNTTSQTKRFDDVSNADQRLVAFINYMSANFGTESLSHRDTYPVAVDSVRPGDLFMYKVGSNGNFTRHAYIIKNINPDGTFDVLYSTQARMAQGLPLRRQQTYMFSKAPLNTGVDKNHWGFRRAKPSDWAHVSQENLSLSNFSQYILAFELGKYGFFKEVRRANQSIQESPNMIVTRNFNTVCNAVTDRVDVVQSALDYVRQVGGQCLGEQKYDAHSTPSRDSGIRDMYYNYYLSLDELIQSSKQQQVDSRLYNLSLIIFGDSALNTEQTTATYQACPVNTTVGSVNLAGFKRRLFEGKVSFHPNDNAHWRWGFENGPRTRCYAYYGYPE